eukprot:1943566-Lingulodinium_polyedra.AAC.1
MMPRVGFAALHDRFVRLCAELAPRGVSPYAYAAPLRPPLSFSRPGTARVPPDASPAFGAMS